MVRRNGVILMRRGVLAASLLLVLSGCGGGEPAQRKAFIAFLQSRILDKPGVHVARPTPDEAKSWGDYAKHYDVILAFNDGLDARVAKPLQEVVRHGAAHSLQALRDQRAAMQAEMPGLGTIPGALRDQLAAAEAARAALVQPADLKAVYDAAYERDVAAPARAFGEVLPIMLDTMSKSLAVADLLADNQARLTVDGSVVETRDNALHAELQKRIEAMNEAGRRVMEQQAKLRAVLTGA